MAYTAPVSTTKVGDIFTDELIAKINEILLDSKNTIGEKAIRSSFDIQIIDNQPDKIYSFKFSFDFREDKTGTRKNIKRVFYYKFFKDYIDKNPSFIIPVDDNFQINADMEMESEEVQ